MRYLKVLFFQALLLGLVLFAANSVFAAPTFQTSYTLNVDYCSTGCLFGSTGGTVALSQNGTGSVTVTVSLNQVDFHGTGLTSFVFNLNGISSVSVSGLPSGFSLVSPSAGSIHEDGSGNFMYAINCPNCGPQSGGIGTSTLTFTVTATGLTTDSFHVLSSGGSPSAYFAASVFNNTNTACTGVIGANGGTTPTNGGSNNGTGACGSAAVPEPSSMALLGSELIGVIGLCPFVPIVRRRLRV